MRSKIHTEQNLYFIYKNNVMTYNKKLQLQHMYDNKNLNETF